MTLFKKSDVTTEDLLKDIEALNGDDEIKRVLKSFIENNLLMASGIIIVWTHGKNVDIDGTKFSETEATWALAKAQYEVLSKGLSFK